MLDSNFWKKLEKKFRSVEDCARVHFNWTDLPGSGDLEMWDCALLGTASLTARLRFETLARRAGTKTDPHCLNSLWAWLSLLKRNGRKDLVKYGREPGHGQIQCVCAVSADYCLVLEARAIEAERRAKIEEHEEHIEELNHPPKQETTGGQIRRLRDECRWTIEELAEAMKIDERTIRRHEADEVNPYARTLRTYERIISKRLERKIVISKMP